MRFYKSLKDSQNQEIEIEFQNKSEIRLKVDGDDGKEKGLK